MADRWITEKPNVHGVTVHMPDELNPQERAKRSLNAAAVLSAVQDDVRAEVLDALLQEIEEDVSIELSLLLEGEICIEVRTVYDVAMTAPLAQLIDSWISYHAGEDDGKLHDDKLAEYFIATRARAMADELCTLADRLRAACGEPISRDESAN